MQISWPDISSFAPQAALGQFQQVVEFARSQLCISSEAVQQHQDLPAEAGPLSPFQLTLLCSLWFLLISTKRQQTKTAIKEQCLHLRSAFWDCLANPLTSPFLRQLEHSAFWSWTGDWTDRGGSSPPLSQSPGRWTCLEDSLLAELLLCYRIPGPALLA